MPAVQSEIRIIWLMLLTIVAVAAWFFDVRLLSYLCALALVMSVMHYVDLLQQPTFDISTQIQTSIQGHSTETSAIQHNSKIPLYLSSLLAVVGALMSWHWLVAAGMTLWIFFFLRWLRRLEQQLSRLQLQVQQAQQSSVQNTAVFQENLLTSVVTDDVVLQSSVQLNLVEQLKKWMFQGNPVLKVAVSVLVIGVILLLRFATEHWQLDLGLQLAFVALLSLLMCGLGYRLFDKNPSFALGLEGLGLAGLFLCLFFAYYNLLIASFAVAALIFCIIMSLTLWLSLKQNSIELALMGMLLAYIAPFTLPVRDMSSVELLAYYWVINVAVAILSSLRSWKFLNQIAFIATLLIASSFAIYRADFDPLQMLALILAHTAIFIWLGFRYSQLLAKQDVAQFKLKPVLDIALIFGAPIVAYILIYLLYFHDNGYQAGLSLGFALLFGLLYQWAKHLHSIAIIAQSYLSLMLIFLSLIPPILLPEQWSVVGWAMQGVLVFIYALLRDSAVSRYLTMALLTVAGLSSLYYVVQLDTFPSPIFWCLSISYSAVVLMANSRASFREQYNHAMLIFHSVLMFFASALLLLLLRDLTIFKQSPALILFIASLSLLLLNEGMRCAQTTWTWLIPKCLALIPLLIYALLILFQHSEQGTVLWLSLPERGYFALSGLVLFMLCLRPKQDFRFAQEPISLMALISLGLASSSIWPAMPYMSLLLLPLLFCGWCAIRPVTGISVDAHSLNDHFQLIWQSKSSLLLLILWMLCSQLFAAEAFHAYLLPLLNPFDVVSLLALVGFIWLLFQQLKTHLDRGIIAILAVLSLLWLSSYILLRALHVYLDTPYNQLALWSNVTVQMSLTLLWVSLAFITMTTATARTLRPLWILGASLLVIVTFKLVLLDLSHIGTLLRVFSFLGAGGVMLLIAYIAPIPELDSSKSIEH